MPWPKSSHIAETVVRTTLLIAAGRAGAADRINDPHASPLRRDRPAAAVVAHRVGASPLHGRRRRPLAASAVAAAARLLAGRDPRLPRPAWLLAAGGDSS